MNLTVNQINYKFYNKLMQEWLGNDYVLMYSTHNESKSVIEKRFIKKLKAKIHKKMIANDSKSYLSYLNKLVDRLNNICHHSISKKPVNVDDSDLTEKIKTDSKAPKFKVNDRVRITKYKNIFSKGCTKNWKKNNFKINIYY